MKKLALLGLTLGLSCMLATAHAETTTDAQDQVENDQPTKTFDFAAFTSEYGESKGGKVVLTRDGTLSVQTELKGNLHEGTMPDYELKMTFLDANGKKLYDESWDLDEVSLGNKEGWLNIQDTSKVGYPSNIQFNHVKKVKVEIQE